MSKHLLIEDGWNPASNVVQKGRVYEAKSSYWTDVTVWNYSNHHHSVDRECALSGYFKGIPAAQFGCQYVSSKDKQVGGVRKRALRHRPLTTIDEISEALLRTSFIPKDSDLARDGDKKEWSEFGACDACGESAGMFVPCEAAINGKRRFCGMKCYRAAKRESERGAGVEQAAADADSQFGVLRGSGTTARCYYSANQYRSHNRGLARERVHAQPDTTSLSYDERENRENIEGRLGTGARILT